MADSSPTLDTRKEIRTALRRTLLLPALVLAFFWIAPVWYGYRLHGDFREQIASDPKLSEADKAQQIEVFDQLDFQAVCLHPPPGLEEFGESLQNGDVGRTYEFLRWGKTLSLILVVLLVACLVTVWILKRNALRSPEALIYYYRLSWRLSIATALIKLVLLIPLLTYGSFEFGVLLADEYSPQVLICIAGLGVFSLWACLNLLFRKVPLEFTEPMSREITPAEAPELWEAIRQAAVKVQTEPPDRLVVGLQFNFFVTELAVITDSGRVEGRTLFLSYLLLKQLSAPEILSIIGHELGHFRGNDTRMTRELYPLKFKIQRTMATLAAASFAGLPSLGLTSYFVLSFESLLQKMSRARELLADRVGADLTSPETIGHALLKMQVMEESFSRMLLNAGAGGTALLNFPWHSFIAEKIPVEDPFWGQLAQKKLPHPFDSHPPLQDRLEALRCAAYLPEARALSIQEVESAYGVWFSGRDDLFTDLAARADTAVAQLQAKNRLTHADYQTDEGKELLEKHFPEVRWQKKAFRLWLIIGFGVAVVLGCLVMMPQIDGTGQVILAVIALGFLLMLGLGFRSRRDEIVLRADALTGPRWKEPLVFADTKDLVITSYNGVYHLRFVLKQPATVTTYGWSRTVRARKVSIGNGWSQTNQVMTQTICNYYFRQT